jgi:DNA-binding transcriptional MerR regulator
MLRSMFTVGAFARLAGVSAKLLRAYDELGLFRPAWVDPQTGYRFYTPAQLPELRRIVALRDMGTPLAEIGTIIKTGNLRDALEKRRKEMDKERKEVERRLHALDIKVEMADSGSAGPDVVMRHLKAQLVATLALELVEGRSAEKGFHELETMVRDHGARAARPPGALISPSVDGTGAPTLKVEVFVPLSKDIPETDRIKTRTLPAGLVATLLHRGAYGTLANARRSLDEWARASGLKTQRAMRILYLQFGAEPELGIPKAFQVDRAADLVTEIQLPVEAS